MYQRIERPNYQSRKEYLEAYRAWLKDRAWPEELVWDNIRHASCPHTPEGSWKLMSYGFYQGADWRYRFYVSHRCTRCGLMVQHMQLCDDEGNGTGAITRQIYGG